MNIFLRFLPLVILSGLALAVFLRLFFPDWQAAKVPVHVMIGKGAPQTLLPLLVKGEGMSETFDLRALAGRVRLVNFWGSWCLPCREEHAQLMQLAQDKRFDLLGINYKDTTSHALSFLTEFGNPFKMIAIDSKGRAAIDWGVYAIPETYLLGRDGRILYRHIGPILATDMEKTILPEIEKALKGI